jgi:DNA topoisomerase-1
MKHLIIVESPAKCNKILSFLDDTYLCEATFGHLRELKSLKNINGEYEIDYTEIPEKKKQIIKLKKQIKSCNEVIIATDDDREGEGIAWHILQMFDLPLSTKRIKFNSITKDAVLHALNNPIQVDMNLVNSQQTRQILDLCVGFKISPILWSEISRKNNLSAGRCQTPALNILYENHQRINNLSQDLSYQVYGLFSSKNIKFTLNKTFDEEKKLFELLQLCHKFPNYNIKHEIRNNVEKIPPKPFITSSLQQSCNNLFNISPKECMSICQKLYESGHITYMRTDSYLLSDKFKEECNKYISTEFGSKYFNNVSSISDKKNSQQAHEAIRPTDIFKVPTLSGKEAKLYTLIRKQTLKSLMNNAILNIHKFIIEIDTVYHFYNNLDEIVFDGWMVLDNIDKENYISYLSNINKITSNKIVGDPTYNNTSLHYTEAKLIKDLEAKNIGRPSTFASIVEKLKERKYVTKTNIDGRKIKANQYELYDNKIHKQNIEKTVGNEKNKLVIQPLGIMVVDTLLKDFQDLFAYNFTETMEHELDLIATGNTNKKDTATLFDNRIDTLITSYNNRTKQKIMIDENHEFIISKNGPVIKCNSGDKIVFKTIIENFDMDKLKRGGYTIDELVDNTITNIHLGIHKEKDIVLKKGKYGIYIEYDGRKISAKSVEKDFEQIIISDIIDLLDEKQESSYRTITNEISIRSGKFGHYIFYKTLKMKKPKFINLKNFANDYMNCNKELILEYVEQNL